MRSLDDSFWNFVERWSQSTSKPTIVLEITGVENWPLAVVKGTVEGFVRGKSIRFLCDDGRVFPLDLEGCRVRSSTKLKPSTDSDIEDWTPTISFKLVCASEEEEDGILVFTELRDFGKV